MGTQLRHFCQSGFPGAFSGVSNPRDGLTHEQPTVTQSCGTCMGVLAQSQFRILPLPLIIAKGQFQQLQEPLSKAAAGGVSLKYDVAKCDFIKGQG